MKIIITAPHSFCPFSSSNQEKQIRVCDMVSAISAYALNNWIKDLNPILLISYTLRSNIDLNRPEAGTTPYHKILNYYLKNSGILIDIHSFPNGASPKMTNEKVSFVIVSNTYDTHDISNIPSNKDYEIYLVLDPLVSNETQQVIEELYYKLSKSVYTGFYYGNKYKNHITHKAIIVGFISILIEFNENLDIIRINEITYIISNWIRNHYNNNNK
jgi:hypothetical protein